MNYGSVCFQRFAFIFKRLNALYFFVVLITCLHFTAYPGTKSLYVVVRMCRQVVAEVVIYSRKSFHKSRTRINFRAQNRLKALGPTKPGCARTYHDGGIVVGVEGDRAPPELEVAQAAHEARRGPHPAPQSLPLFVVPALW